MGSAKTVSQRLRRQVARRYGVQPTGQPHSVFCAYCLLPGEITWWPRGSHPNHPGSQWVKSSLDFDHIVPVSRGGADHESNIVVACPWCNVSKSDRDLAEWLEILRTTSRLERRATIIQRMSVVVS